MQVRVQHKQHLSGLHFTYMGCKLITDFPQLLNVEFRATGELVQGLLRRHAVGNSMCTRNSKSVQQ